MSEGKANCEHLKNLEFADSQKTGGLEFYFSLMEGEVKKGVSGPVALKSVFGWVLCGRYDVCDEMTKHTLQFFNKTHCLRVSSVDKESGN